METQKFEFFRKNSKFEFWLLTKSWNHLSFVNISPTLVIDTSMERSSRVLHHGNPKCDFLFQKSSKFEFWRRAEISLGFVNINPTLVSDTSMERSSRVLEHGNIIIWFKKNSKLNFNIFFFFNSKLNFDLCQRDEIIQVGLNMHPYDDIGDASSSLRGSTSSLKL